jgi:hypothetical protein
VRRDFEVPLYEQSWPDGEYRLFQVGFLVDDIGVAARRWASVFGVGPFYVTGPTTVECLRGQDVTTVEMTTAVAQAGPVQIELIRQSDDTPSIFQDFAKDERGAFHQMCTLTTDYDRKVAGYQARGFELATEMRAPGYRVAFFDMRADFGFYLEIVEAPENYLEMRAETSRICAEWDGTDPVRQAVEGGYRVVS